MIIADERASFNAFKVLWPQYFTVEQFCLRHSTSARAAERMIFIKKLRKEFHLIISTTPS